MTIKNKYSEGTEEEDILISLDERMIKDIIKSSEEDLCSELLKENKHPKTVISNTRRIVQSALKEAELRYKSSTKNTFQQKPKLVSNKILPQPEELIARMAASGGIPSDNNIPVDLKNIMKRISLVRSVVIDKVEVKVYEGENQSTLLYIDVDRSPSKLIINNKTYSLVPSEQNSRLFQVCNLYISEVIWPLINNELDKNLQLYWKK